MHSITKIFCTCFFVLWLSGTFAQASKKDSLVNELSKATQDTSKIKILINLSFSLRTVDPSKSLEYGKVALQLSQKISSKKQEAKSLNNIGLAYYYLPNYDSALAYYQHALNIGTSLPDSTIISLAYSQMGNVYKAYSNFPLSIEYHKKALSIRLNKKDTFNIIQSYSNLGNAYVRNTQYELAMDSYVKALELLKEKKESPEYLYALGGVANVFFYQKNYKKAIEIYQQNLILGKEKGEKKHLEVTLLNLGQSYTYLKKYDTALVYLHQLINRGINNKAFLAQSYISISAAYEGMHNYDKAIDYSQKAVALLREVNQQAELAEGILNVALLYIKTKDTKGGEKYLNEGLTILDSIKNKDVAIEMYAKVAKCYNLLGDNLNAYIYIEKSAALKDSLLTANSIQTIAQMQSTFDLKTKENEIKLLNNEKEISDYKIGRQQTVIVSLSIGGVLFILLVFFVFRGYKKARSANQALSLANDQINEKNKNISDSINYAKNIQNAILTVPKGFKEQFKDNYFILYKPKDVVSGDFYWIEYHDRHLLIASADCTGHGVPGSLMSMLGFEKLKQAVHEKMLLRPNKILSFTNKSFIETFSLNETTSFLRDGMDIALCTFNLASNELLFSGANRPLWILTTNDTAEKEIKALKATKAAIGGFTEREQEFDLINYSPKRGDIIYIFTDGYADQFGGERNKKYTVKRFRELIISIAHLPLPEQQEKLETEFNSWKSVYEQVDDVLVIGFRIP